MRRRGRPWPLLLLTLTLLTGCWGRLEVNDLGMGTGMAIDKGRQQAVRVTLYLARGLAGAKGGEPVWTVMREAATIPDAILLINRSSSRRVTLEHLRVIVVSEAYARSGMDDLLDFIGRHSEIRLTTRFLLGKGEASTYLTANPRLEALMPESLVKTLEAKGGPQPRVKEFMVASVAEPYSPWLYWLRTQTGQRGNEPEIAGKALFVSRRLVEMLDLHESIALAWLLQNPDDAVVSVPCSDDPAKRFSVRIEKGRAKIVPALSGDRVSFQVKGQLNAILVSSECANSTIALVGQRTRFEEQVQATMLKYMRSCMERMQALRADPAGFGKRVQMRYPAFFRRNKTRWPDLWAESEVTYDLRVTLRHSRLLLEPINRTRPELQREQGSQ